MSADVSKSSLKSPVPIMLLTKRGMRAPNEAGDQKALYRPYALLSRMKAAASETLSGIVARYEQ